MKNVIKIFILVMFTVSLYGCFPNNAHPNNPADLPGFWLGTWHGFISGFSFISSLFDDSIRVYAINNNGHWYDFGFVGGLFFILRLVNTILKSNE